MPFLTRLSDGAKPGFLENGQKNYLVGENVPEQPDDLQIGTEQSPKRHLTVAPTQDTDTVHVLGPINAQRDYINVQQDLQADMEDPDQLTLAHAPAEDSVRVVDCLMRILGFCLSGTVTVLGVWKLVEIIKF
jgi:hypothetical protein